MCLCSVIYVNMSIFLSDCVRHIRVCIQLGVSQHHNESPQLADKVFSQFSPWCLHHFSCLSIHNSCLVQTSKCLEEINIMKTTKNRNLDSDLKIHDGFLDLPSDSFLSLQGCRPLFALHVSISGQNSTYKDEDKL